MHPAYPQPPTTHPPGGCDPRVPFPKCPGHHARCCLFCILCIHCAALDSGGVFTGCCRCAILCCGCVCTCAIYLFDIIVEAYSVMYLMPIHMQYVNVVTHLYPSDTLGHTQKTKPSQKKTTRVAHPRPWSRCQSQMPQAQPPMLHPPAPWAPLPPSQCPY